MTQTKIEIYGNDKVTIHVYPSPPDITLDLDPDPGEEKPEEEEKPNLKAVSRKKRVNEK